VDDLAQRAGDAFDSADYQASYLLALDGLRDDPEHAGLLGLAGRAAMELGLDDAASYLGRLVAQVPHDASAWRDLAMALLGSADTDGAEQALRTALRLDPGESVARVGLGHIAFLGGAVEEADRLLWEAARLAPHDIAPLRSLVEMHRLQGRPQAALEAASELARRAPEDVAARLDLADLHLALGNTAESLAEYRRLRELDSEHAGYLVHGMIEAEIQRERWRRALDLAITATALDRHRLTTDVLALVSARLFGEGDRPPPRLADVEARLREQREIHRRLHAEALASGRNER
jgi:Flp pilus assembly protein TadD